MKIFFDTEFMEDGERIVPLSIGMVREDGNSYYAEFDVDEVTIGTMANEFVLEHVIPHLHGDVKAKRDVIAKDIVAFVGEDPEFWAYYADYDWIVLCQLYGTMIDLPDGWPMYCRDLKQLMDDKGVDRESLHDPVQAHNALSDALWVRQVHSEAVRVVDSSVPRRFNLIRFAPSKLAGELKGWGVLFPDGTCCVQSTTRDKPRSMINLVAVRGEYGQYCHIKWID